MFQDVLVVLSGDKSQQFCNEMISVMEQYYQMLATSEEKRMKDAAKSRLNELLTNYA